MKTKKKKYTEPPKFKQADIRLIRKEKTMTQNELAAYLGVTKKAVESWEYGINTPSGAVCRLLSLLQTENAPLFEKTDKHYLVGRKLYDPATKITGTWATNENGLCVIFTHKGEKIYADCGQMVDMESEYLWHKQFGQMSIQREVRKRAVKKQLVDLLEE